MQNQQNTQPGQYTFPISGYTTPYTTTPAATEPSQSQPAYLPAASTSTSSVPVAGTSSVSVAGTSNAAGSSSAPLAGTSSTQASNAPGPSRQQAEEARKDRTLAEFLLMLDDYEPLIPNEVTDYYLQRVGFECEDVRLKRLLSLAAQKFVADIAGDAYQHARIRTNAAGARGRTAAPYGMSKDKTRTTLTMDDLSAALSEYGIDARKPDFYL
ncbi:transcription initiation factor IID, TAF10 subunit [Schizophyllum commune H4-8]|uniref:Transcription initiation factor TFIID subunit 10 n=1 Tax=Schizophyllum commune (strain H4-8 / FGSC 9210) TaxID=578458 RepID=D8Q3C8_SCHCM|nr:transcription initiation factor IID, TAF10 subunit [Schizophyllum commune H4-8]KAI5894833.1 transcription initiation factor IID, TAF10 subunit [Schizophyllum commune H4-8]